MLIHFIIQGCRSSDRHSRFSSTTTSRLHANAELSHATASDSGSSASTAAAEPLSATLSTIPAADDDQL